MPKLNAVLNQTSISGFSSGAIFAAQFAVIYSSFIKGAGIIAGLPYDCATSNTGIGESCFNASIIPDITGCINVTKSRSGITIDNISNMANQKIYMVSGSVDPIVPTAFMDQVYNYYVTVGNFTPATNVFYKKTSSSNPYTPDWLL